MLGQPGIGGRQRPQNKRGLLLYYSIDVRGKKKQIKEQHMVNRVWSELFLFILNAGHYCFSIFSHFRSVSRLLKTVVELDKYKGIKSSSIVVLRCPPGPRVYGARCLASSIVKSSSITDGARWMKTEHEWISSTVSQDRWSIELGWHIELDGSVSSSVAQKTNMIQTLFIWTMR